jgi:hypothetical protein
MTITQKRLLVTLAFAIAAMSMATTTIADPLPGRDRIKFSQKPMIATTVPNSQGIPGVYHGHDELSTAYGFGTAALPPVVYQGKFMADDFADTLSDPVVHVKWWGSYLDNVINPNMPVNKFLISFEADVPAGPSPSFSHPGQPLLNQVVFRGPLAPGSGTFTENLILPAGPGVPESLYEYNAELHLGKAFPELKDTVYWLKVVAMVDAPINTTFDPFNPPAIATRWGWHNRDYTIKDPLASTNVNPGENNQGPFNGVPVWHFQDDAVTGDVRIFTSTTGGLVMPAVEQPVVNMLPTHYVDGLDGPGIPGALGIARFSKDLSFELYTVVPEPTTCLLSIVAMAGLVFRRRTTAVVI